MQDYYGLYGIFDSTRYPWPGIELEQRQRDLVAVASDEEVQTFWIASRRSKMALDKAVKEIEELLKTVSSDDKPTLEKELKAAKDQSREHSQIEPPYELLYAVADKPESADATIQLKGDPAKPGDLVSRKFPPSWAARYCRRNSRPAADCNLSSGCSSLLTHYGSRNGQPRLAIPFRKRFGTYAK